MVWLIGLIIIFGILIYRMNLKIDKDTNPYVIFVWFTNPFNGERDYIII